MTTTTTTTTTLLPMAAVAGCVLRALAEGVLLLRQRRRQHDREPAAALLAALEGGPAAHKLSSGGFEAAQSYGRSRSALSAARIAFSATETSLSIVMGLLPAMWRIARGWAGLAGWADSELAVTAAFACIAYAYETALSLPFSAYAAFVVEQRHGFNRQTPRSFAVDVVKTAALSAVIGLPLLCLFVSVARWSGEHAELLWAVQLVVVLAAVFVYPTVIAPCFNKFTPLPEGPVRHAVQRVADECGFPSRALYVVDGSTRSTHSNAYVFGFCGARRVVVYDTLLKQMESDPQQVAAVVAHEMGHWKKSHTVRGLIISQVYAFVMMLAFGRAIGWGAMYER
jgi:STE24 endopeptidase